jgi:hypothetical protein
MEAWDDLAHRLAAAKLAIPAVTLEVAERLFSTEGGWRYCTDSTFSWDDAYVGCGVMPLNEPPHVLNRLDEDLRHEQIQDSWPTEDNFFFFGHAGHGMNSWCLTLMQNLSKLSILIQTPFGGGFRDPDTDVLLQRRLMDFWRRIAGQVIPQWNDCGEKWLLVLDAYRGERCGIYVQLGSGDKSAWEQIVSLRESTGPIKQSDSPAELIGRLWSNPALNEAAEQLCEGLTFQATQMWLDHGIQDEFHDYLEDSLAVNAEDPLGTHGYLLALVRACRSRNSIPDSVPLAGEHDFHIDHDEDEGDSQVSVWCTPDGRAVWLTIDDDERIALRYKGIWLYGADSLPDTDGLLQVLVPPPYIPDFDAHVEHEADFVLNLDVEILVNAPAEPTEEERKARFLERYIERRQSPLVGTQVQIAVRANSEPVSPVDQLRMLLADKALMRRALERMLPNVDDMFLFQPEAQGLDLPYVQGILEDSTHLHLELCHESFIGAAITTSARAELHRRGWDEPSEGLPNYNQFIDRALVSDAEIAALCVDALDVAYSLFDALPDGATLLVEPMTVALAALGDDDDVVGVIWPGEKQEQSLNFDLLLPDAASPVPSGSLHPETVADSPAAEPTLEELDYDFEYWIEVRERERQALENGRTTIDFDEAYAKFGPYSVADWMVEPELRRAKEILIVTQDLVGWLMTDLAHAYAASICRYARERLEFGQASRPLREFIGAMVLDVDFPDYPRHLESRLPVLKRELPMVAYSVKFLNDFLESCGRYPDYPWQLGSCSDIAEVCDEFRPFAYATHAYIGQAVDMAAMMWRNAFSPSARAELASSIGQGFAALDEGRDPWSIKFEMSRQLMKEFRDSPELDPSNQLCVIPVFEESHVGHEHGQDAVPVGHFRQRMDEETPSWATAAGCLVEIHAGVMVCVGEADKANGLAELTAAIAKMSWVDAYDFTPGQAREAREFL